MEDYTDEGLLTEEEPMVAFEGTPLILTELYGNELKILIHNQDRLVKDFNLNKDYIENEALYLIKNNKIFKMLEESNGGSGEG